MKTKFWIILSLLAALSIACQGGGQDAESRMESSGADFGNNTQMAKEDYAEAYDQEQSQPEQLRLAFFMLSSGCLCPLSATECRAKNRPALQPNSKSLLYAGYST